MKPVIVHGEASAELDEAVAYYEQQQPGLGLRLLSDVQRTVTRIQLNPQLGTPYKETAFRRALVRRFPYVVFYADLENAVWVIAVTHAKRRPDYWRQRHVG